MARLQIVGGTLFDAVSGEIMQNGVVCIEGDRITAVGPASAIPTGGRDVQVLDAAGQFVMPGMIDCHVHLLSSGAADYAVRGLKELLPYTAIRGAANAKILLDMGYTTLRDVGAMGYGNIALRQAIEDGLVPGPRLYVAGHALSVPGGHGDSYYRPEVHVERAGLINGPEEARRAVRELIKMRADVIKLLVTGGVMTDGSDVGVLQWAPEELQVAIAQAHQLGRRVAGHCHGAAGVKEAIRAGLDTVEHGTLLDEEAMVLMYRHGTYYVPTLVAPFHICAGGTASGIPAYAVQKSHLVMERHKESVRQAHELGIKIAMGTDCGTPFNMAGKNALELELLMQNGLSAAEALMATTRVAAEAIGMQACTGTLEPGKWADVIVVHGNPLDDIRVLQHAERIICVIKAGQPVKGAPPAMPVAAAR
ncbi:MAG TPA: amidohydrolase family protein [Candidatus Tectomicrobia bacterium]|jgi:imidazolonepropionase-like amidohydrolase